MDIDFIPKLRKGQDRAVVFDKIDAIIQDRITAKAKAKLEAMSLEELKDNHYTAILPEIPKTKKGIDKAIEKFIKDMQPEKDNGEEVLEYLGFYDIGEGIEEGDWTIRAKYLRERIKFKEEGDTITILSSTKEVVNVVIEYLQSLPTEELYNLWVFGIVVTEEEANKNKEDFIDQAKYKIFGIYYYVNAKFDEGFRTLPQAPEDDILLKAGEDIFNQTKDAPFHSKDKTDKENIKLWSEKIRAVITEYPEETIAYYRANKMRRTNYTDKAILSTLDKILNNGDTTD